jgi:hypothetical protein
MKTEHETLELVQRLYARTGRDAADIVCVRALHGGWHNALKYEAERYDHRVAAIGREDLEAGDDTAIVNALRAFAAPEGEASLCSVCGKWATGRPQYCSRCGNFLGDAAHEAHRAGHVRNVTIAKRAALAVALTCMGSGIAYWFWTYKPSMNALREQRPQDMPPSSWIAGGWESAGHGSARFEEGAAITPGRLASSEGASQMAGKRDTPAVAPPLARRPAASRRATPRAATPPHRDLPRPNTGQELARANAGSSGTYNAKETRVRSVPAARATLDRIYEARARAECERTILGFVCRERLRWRVCKDNWTPDKTGGMSVCYVPEYPEPLS